MTINKLRKRLVLIALIFATFVGISSKASAQTDSLIFREMDLKRIGVNYFNFSKPDKFNFEVIVLGGVKAPGIYLLSEGASLIELVALTGGAIDESIFDNFKLIRAKAKNPELKADTVMIISYKDFFDKDKTGSVTKHNPLLKGGDIISFPIKPDKNFWDYAQVISTVFVIPLITIASLIINILNYSK